LAWHGKTELSPATSTVYLQIYNFNSTTWETLDFSTIDTSVNFDLNFTITTDVENYYDGSYWVVARVYQDMII